MANFALDLHSLTVLRLVFLYLYSSMVPKDRGIMSGTFILRNVRMAVCQRLVNNPPLGVGL